MLATIKPQQLDDACFPLYRLLQKRGTSHRIMRSADAAVKYSWSDNPGTNREHD